MTAIIGSLVLNIALVLADRYSWWTPPSHFFAGFTVIVAGVVLYVAVSLLRPSPSDAERFDALLPTFTGTAPHLTASPTRSRSEVHDA